MKYKDYANYAYTAGLIDGEGCIHIDKSNPKPHKGEVNPRYVLKVHINMTDGRALDFMYGFWGGFTKTQEIKKENHNTMYLWDIECGKAAALLKKCLPFFRTKKEQAEVAIRFRQRQEQEVKKRLNRGKGSGRGSRPHEQHTIDFFEQSRIKLQELKKDLKPLNAVAETKRTNHYNMISDSPDLIE